MARYDENGGRVACTLFEAAAFQYAIKATCRCGHSEILDPHALWWLFERKGWDGKLEAAEKRFRCLRCGDRRSSLALAHEHPTLDRLPMPPHHEWKRAVSRFRS